MEDLLSAIQPLIGYILAIILSGGIGGAYGVKQKNNLKDTLASLLPGSNVTTATKVMQENPEYDIIYKTTPKERNYLMSKIKNPAMQLAVLNLIESKEEKGCTDYTFKTEEGVWRILNGFIDEDPTLNVLSEPAVVEAPKDTTSMNAYGKTIGDAEVLEIGSNHIEIYDGVILKQDDFIGKDINVTFKGTAYGLVVAGMFWDGQDTGLKGVFMVGGELETGDSVVFRFPQYKAAKTVGDMSLGEHTLEIAFGYYAGYKETGNKRGDQTIWKHKTPYRINVVE